MRVFDIYLFIARRLIVQIHQNIRTIQALIVCRSSNNRDLGIYVNTQGVNNSPICTESTLHHCPANNGSIAMYLTV